MHRNVLNSQQNKLLPLLSRFNQHYGLVGGTAITLQIGHRRSIDFDLFTNRQVNHDQIRKLIKDFGSQINQTLIESKDELSLIVDQVKFTFYQYPYCLEFPIKFDDYAQLPTLQVLGAMKAFALGKRGVWRDYVDLYYLFKEAGVEAVINQAHKIYHSEFNLKLFKSQLIYFEDLKQEQPLDLLPGFSATDEEIKQFLEQVSLEL